jgi:hypothetical protein
MDFYVSMALAVIFQVLKTVIKNPKSKADMKSACLKLRNSINAAYADDPDFE